jgi:hypothetical protein
VQEWSRSRHRSVRGFAVGDTWRTGAHGTAPIPSALNDQLRSLPETGGQVTTPHAAWAWAYPLAPCGWHPRVSAGARVEPARTRPGMPDRP